MIPSWLALCLAQPAATASHSGSLALPVGSILLFLTTLCVDFARPHTGEVSHLYVECLCWALIAFGSTAWCYLRPQLRRAEDGNDHGESASDTLAWTIVATIVCRQLVDLDWALPLVTPLLYIFIDRGLYEALPTFEGDGKETFSTSVATIKANGTWISAGILALAVASAFALAAAPAVPALALVAAHPTLYTLAVGALFVFFECQLLFAMTSTARDGSRPTASSMLFSPMTAVRVATGLFFMSLLSPRSPPALGLLAILAVLKAAQWISLLVVCQTASAIAPSTVATYSAGIFHAFQAPSAHSAAPALAALVALVQNHIFLPRSPFRLMITGAVSFITLFTVFGKHPSTVLTSDPARWLVPEGAAVTYDGHPIAIMAAQARERYATMLDSQSKTLEQAIAEYERRYRRSPPPGFDMWYAQATANQVQLIDEYDMIMDTLEPFWGMSPQEIRHRARLAMDSGAAILRVAVKGGEVDGEGDLANRLRQFGHFMPDVEVAVNVLDEPRVVVPHDRLQQSLEECVAVVAESDGSGAEPKVETASASLDRLEFVDIGSQRIWSVATLSCPVDSPSRSHVRPAQDLSYLSFIHNATASKDVCLAPDAGDLHGLFIGPASMQLTTSLVPIFSSGKASSYQDVLFPSGSYVEEDENADTTIPVTSWDEKANQLFWRGSSTGGTATMETWRKMHRHRFVQMMNDNAAEVKYLQRADERSDRWTPYRASMSMVSDLFNVSMTATIQCPEEVCEEESKGLTLGTKTHPLAGRRAKYVFDMDGNGWSGRYYRLLRSHSTILKQTMFKEWHDDWLVPWVHYVPISLEMTELAETMRFLARTDAGQDISRYIAEEGRRWALASLRDVDLNLYLYRTMLEYARLVDDGREALDRCEAESLLAV